MDLVALAVMQTFNLPLNRVVPPVAEVHVLPGIERRDLAGNATPSEDVLQAAIDNGITDAVVLGRDRAGNFYIAGAPPDVDKTVGMLMRAVTVLSQAEIINDVVIGGAGPDSCA